VFAVVLLLWLGISKLYLIGVEKEDSDVLFLILMGMVSVVLHLV
jgi:hypothetical protein